jgi:hypothetical protein
VVHLGQWRGLRWFVRVVLTLGVAVSVAANMLHARPNLVSEAIAAWPPIALLLTVELVSRVPILRAALAVARIGATIAIAGIAAWVSYWHMAGVAARYGETGASPYLLPISVDGLIVVASVCLVELGGRISTTPTGIADRAAASTSSPPLQTPDLGPHLDRQLPVGPALTWPTGAADAAAGATISTSEQDALSGRGPAEPAAAPTQTRQEPATGGVGAEAGRSSAQAPMYEPNSIEDATMHRAWQQSVAAGRTPSGADLARAAGRPDDSTGIGRKAARRYRTTQQATHTTSPAAPAPSESRRTQRPAEGRSTPPPPPHAQLVAAGR